MIDKMRLGLVGGVYTVGVKEPVEEPGLAMSSIARIALYVLKFKQGRGMGQAYQIDLRTAS